MVKLTTLLCFVVSSCFLNAQEKQDINTHIKKVDNSTQPFKSKSNSGHVAKSELNQPVTISKKAGEAQQVHDDAYYQKEIAKIDSHLNAINTKIAYVNNNPTEKSNAIASGWFDDMELYKTKLNTQKQLLQSKLTN